MKKRTWYYVLNPVLFEMFCPKCKGTNITWSEYEHRIWCYDCKEDILHTTESEGIFNGPIALEACLVLGIVFHRIYLKSGKIMKPVETKKGLIYRQCSKKELEMFEGGITCQI